MKKLVYLCLLLSSINEVFAQNQYFNQQILPLGDESALLANSGIAGQSPNSAVIFNPAALSLNHGRSLSFSGNAYYEFNFVAENLANINGQSLDLKASGFQVLPTSLIYHYDYWGWQWSFALTSPAYLNYDGLNQFNFGREKVYIEENLHEVLYSGFLGAGKEMAKGWSIGFSLYGNYYSLSSNSNISYYRSNPGAGFSSLREFREAESYSLGFSLGLLKKWSKVRLGLVYSSANIDFYSKGRSLRTTSNSLFPQIAFTEDYQDNLNTHLAHGHRFGIGLHYLVSQKLEWSADINIYGQASQNLFPQDSLLPLGSLRLSSGIKHQWNSKLANYLGLAYLPRDRPESQETFILSLGSRFKFNRSLNSLSIFFARGRESIEASPVRMDYFGILLGTSIDLEW